MIAEGRGVTDTLFLQRLLASCCGLASWPLSDNAHSFLSRAPLSFKMTLLQLAVFFLPLAFSQPVTLTINLQPLFGTLEPTYASFNLDPSCNRGFHNTDFTNPNLIAAAKGLSPSRLRFGGSGADYLTYSFTQGAPDCPAPLPDAGCHYVTPGCLNASQGGALLDLGAAAGVQFIFGVAFNETAACNGEPWDIENAARLLAFLNATGRTVWAFELGNVRSFFFAAAASPPPFLTLINTPHPRSTGSEQCALRKARAASRCLCRLCGAGARGAAGGA